MFATRGAADAARLLRAARAAGVLAVDHSNASSLALLDPRTRTWSERGAGRDRRRPRRCCPSWPPATQPVGPVTAAFAEATGLAPDTVVAVGCGDEMAATLGAGVFAPGEVCDVVGTAEPVCAASAEPRAGPDDAGRVPPPRRPRRVAAGEPGVRLRRQPPLVARPVRAARAGRRGARAAATPTTCSPRRPRRSRPAPRAWCSCPACRGRWRRSGTARPGACSTA